MQQNDRDSMTHIQILTHPGRNSSLTQAISYPFSIVAHFVVTRFPRTVINHSYCIK